jgi:hypothetical protein
VKYVLTSLMFMVSLFAHGMECTNTLAGLKTLTGHQDISMDWFETDASNPLTLNLSDKNDLIFFKLTNSDGVWAEVLGKFCKVDQDSYLAKTSEFKWGPEAPFLAKMKTIKEISIELPNIDSLKVSVSLFSFNFKPLKK